MIIAWLVCLILLVLDAAAVTLVLDLHASASATLRFAVMHAVACLLFAPALLALLPARYRQRAPGAVAFAFVMAAVLPVLGMAGLLLCLVPALRWPNPAGRAVLWQHPRPPSLPDRPGAAGGPARGSWAAGLAGALQHSNDPKRRAEAVISTLSLDDHQAVPLLRRALKDPEDEVRLLAYALLNRKEKQIEVRTRKRLTKLDTALPEEAFLLHKALAHDYWEFAQLAAPLSSSQLSLCARAREHVLAALQLRPADGGLHFLLGLVLLAERSLDAASDAFDQAQAMGVDQRQVAPLRAAISFHAGRYTEVKHRLRAAGACRSQPGFGKIAAYWEGTGRAAVTP
jgi:hypothetical protein